MIGANVEQFVDGFFAPDQIAFLERFGIAVVGMAAGRSSKQAVECGACAVAIIWCEGMAGGTGLEQLLAPADATGAVGLDRGVAGNCGIGLRYDFLVNPRSGRFEIRGICEIIGEDQAVGAAGEERLAVGGEHDGPDGTLMLGENPQPVAIAPTPDAHRAVHAAGRHQFTVFGEIDREDRSDMAEKRR